MPVPPRHHPFRVYGTLEQPRCRPVEWTDAMLEMVDLCAIANAPVMSTARAIGVDKEALARGALLRLRQVLLQEPGE
jgi:hypothetical protein